MIERDTLLDRDFLIAETDVYHRSGGLWVLLDLKGSLLRHFYIHIYIYSAKVNCESGLLRRISARLDRQQPLVAVGIMAAAKEEASQGSTVEYRSKSLHREEARDGWTGQTSQRLWLQRLMFVSNMNPSQQLALLTYLHIEVALPACRWYAAMVMFIWKQWCMSFLESLEDEMLYIVI